MGCDSYANGEADTKPFSIRQFVGATRRRDIFSCWPFLQKHLQICLKYGISNMLPPFEPCTAAIQTTTHKTSGLMCSQQDKENVLVGNNVRDVIMQEKLIKDEYCNSYNEVLLKAPCHDCFKSHLDNSCKHKDESTSSSDFTSNVIVPLNRQSSSIRGSDLNAYTRISTLSPKRLVQKKRRHKRRQKKRSMLVILAKAKPCTLEDLYRLRCNSISITNEGDERSRLVPHVEEEDEANN